MKLSILSDAPVISNTKLSVPASRHGRGTRRQAERLDAVVAFAAHLHHRQLALDRGTAPSCQ
jgi:hypothetical protein